LSSLLSSSNHSSFPLSSFVFSILPFLLCPAMRPIPQFMDILWKHRASSNAAEPTPVDPSTSRPFKMSLQPIAHRQSRKSQHQTHIVHPASPLPLSVLQSRGKGWPMPSGDPALCPFCRRSRTRCNNPHRSPQAGNVRKHPRRWRHVAFSTFTRGRHSHAAGRKPKALNPEQ